MATFDISQELVVTLKYLMKNKKDYAKTGDHPHSSPFTPHPPKIYLHLPPLTPTHP